jgi:hypothetical protein
LFVVLYMLRHLLSSRCPSLLSIVLMFFWHVLVFSMIGELPWCDHYFGIDLVSGKNTLGFMA